MRSLVYTTFALLLSLSVMAQKTIHDPNAEARNVSGFHAIHVSGAIELHVSQSASEGVAVSAQDMEDVSSIRTEVNNGVLRIWSDSKANWFRGRKLKAYVSVISLDELRASGASNVRLEGSISLQQLKLNLSGASDLEGGLAVTGLFELNLSGASDAKISGTASQMKINVSGASDLKAYDFTTTSCDVVASGASDVRVTVEKEMTAVASGASDVSYKGNAVIKDIRTSGASSITRRS